MVWCMSKELVAGQKLQTYEIISVLGEGGMSRVYLCQDLVLGRRVALKQLIAEGSDKRSIIRLQQEGQSLARLSHPNIVQILAFFNSDDGDPVLVMELLHGCSLAELLANVGSLSVGEVVKLAEQMCDALQHAHDAGIVHRDVKPTNIFLCNKKIENAKIIDFGIAKIADNSVNATRTGEFVGSPAYLSPEQALQKPITERSDQYSLGCVLYECLTGHPPFVDDTAMGLILKHINDEAAPLSKSTFVPPVVAKAIERSLRKDPESRFGSMNEFKNALAGRVVAQEKRMQPKVDALLVGALGALFVAVAGIAVWFVVSFAAPHKKAEPTKTMAPVVTNKKDSWTVPNLSDSYPSIERHTTDGAKDQRFIELTIQSNPLIEDLPLGTRSITHGSLVTLAKFKNLKALHMGDTDLGDTVTGDEAGEYLSKIRTLELLDVSRTHVGDSFVAKISTLPKLKTLDLVDTKITPQGLAPLAQAPSLDDLSVRTNMIIDDSSANAIEKMSHLETLDVSKTSIGNVFVGRVASHLNLRNFKLGATQVSQKCFPDLAKMTSLAVLHLDDDEGITDLSILRNLPLTELSLKHNLIAVNSPIARQISQFTQLRTLRLSQTALKDSDLLMLAKAPKLSSLEIFECDLLTPKGIAAFKKLKPKCRVATENYERNAKYEKAESMFRDLGDGVKGSPGG